MSSVWVGFSCLPADPDFVYYIFTYAITLPCSFTSRICLKGHFISDNH